MRKHRDKKESKKLTIWIYVLKYCAQAFVFVSLLFYMFYLYGKYAKDREAVASFYDDQKDQLRAPYHTIMWVLMGIAACFLLAVAVIFGPGAPAVFGLFVAIFWGIGWVIDHLAAKIAGKDARYTDLPRM